MTCLGPSGDKRKRLEKQRRVYEEVVVPMVQKMNQSPSEWLLWHSPKKKKEREALFGVAIQEMFKICGHSDRTVFQTLKLKASVAEGCLPLRKSTRSELNGGVRPTKAQHEATNAEILKVRWGTSQLSIHPYVHSRSVFLPPDQEHPAALSQDDTRRK